MATSLTWKQRITYLAVIYGMLERDMKLCEPLEGDQQFLNPILEEMSRHELVALPGVEWIVTERGRELRKSMVAMYDQLTKFEIFGAVQHTRALTLEEENPDTLGQVYDTIHDPRFAEGEKVEDLRLAMLAFLSETLAEQLEGQAVNLYEVVFMQKLRAGVYKAKEDIWFYLRCGTIFTDIEQIVASAYKWRDVAGDREEAAQIMGTIYTAGMLEQQKRDGEHCSECQACLAVFELHAKRESRSLTECPSCSLSFVPVAAEGVGSVEEVCPNCNATIASWHRKCRGCGARIKRSLPEGSVHTTTTVTEAVDVAVMSPWGYSYDYYGYAPPLVYYDPWDPSANAFAFGCTCALLF